MKAKHRAGDRDDDSAAEIEIDTQDRVQRALRATPTRLGHGRDIPLAARSEAGHLRHARRKPLGIVPSPSSVSMIFGDICATA